MIFSREIPISLGEQAEIDREVKLFESFFYKGLFVLEQQPSDKRKEAAKNFLDEIKTLFKKILSLNQPKTILRIPKKGNNGR